MPVEAKVKAVVKQSINNHTQKYAQYGNYINLYVPNLNAIYDKTPDVLLKTHLDVHIKRKSYIIVYTHKL